MLASVASPALWSANSIMMAQGTLADAAPVPLRRPRRRASISLTPLIDVVFILLVFFMLATSFVDWRMIPLAAAGEGRGSAGAEGTVLLDFTPDALRISGASVSEAEFARRIASRLATHPEQRFVLRPRDGANMQRLVSLLDRLEALGVRHVDLASGR